MTSSTSCSPTAASVGIMRRECKPFVLCWPAYSTVSPDLQIITGHWGELILFYLERIAGLRRRQQSCSDPSRTMRGRIFTSRPSGMFSARYLRWTLEVMGIDRLMFSSDYPYRFAPDGGARAFLEQAELDTKDKGQVRTRELGGADAALMSNVDRRLFGSRQDLTRGCLSS